MPLQPVDPSDARAVAASVELHNAANQVDDPAAPVETVELITGHLRYGWDLQPETRYLYRSTPDGAVVGVVGLNVPQRDNRHLVEGDFVIHPDHRHQGHGAAMLSEVLALVAELGRTTLWLYPAEGDEVAAGFLTRRGFTRASHDARRFQRLADVDWRRVDELEQAARPKAADYDVERIPAPTPEPLLRELVSVVAAINDAPMGDLAFDDEVFDLRRLQDMETAALSKGERMYQVIARRTSDGAIGGHTVMVHQPLRPEHAEQYNTAVHRDHRGHRLGLLLKIEMMRWLVEAEPQVLLVETWNNADNDPMISVNEQLGYVHSKTFDAYQLVLD